MHYNHFTIAYIEAIKQNLPVEINSNGNAICFPDLIKKEDVSILREKLQDVWQQSQSAIDIVEKKHDSIIQSGLFGLVNELEIALKIGFLIGDRVILIDYLFERLLSQEFTKISIIHLCSVATSLVNVLPLAKTGRIVIIPNPFNWNKESKIIIEEVCDKILPTANALSLINMLSITKRCHLHPYTIAESESNYNDIINNHLDTTMVIGKDNGTYAYNGILGALLSEKLLSNIEFKFILELPINDFFESINSNKQFYIKYLSELIFGGSQDDKVKIDILKERITAGIQERNKIIFPTQVKTATTLAGVSSGIIGIVSSTMAIASPITLAGALLALSATLTGLMKTESKEDPIISVFSNIYKSYKKQVK